MTTSLRDVTSAQMVNALAEVGYFDKEYIVYGCAFWQDDKVKYIVTNDYNELYEFKQEAVWKHLCATKTEMRKMKDSLLSGMERESILKLKLALAKELQEKYPKEYFLEELAIPYEDTAYEILCQWKDRIDGYFEADDLQVFEEAVRFAYEKHKLTFEHRKELRKWIKHVRAQMDDNVEQKDQFMRVFWGFVHEKDGRVRYIANANQEMIYTQKAEAEEQGGFVSPMFHKRYWYNRSNQLPEVRKQFEKELKGLYNEQYLASMKAMLATEEKTERGCKEEK